MRNIAYIRVSSDEQADSGLGMEAQLAKIKGKFGDIVYHMYRDDGFTGSNINRPGIIAALESLGKGDRLLVAKRDRLARDMFLSMWIEKEVKKRGATIVSAAGEGTESDDPAQVLMRRMVDAFAEYELAVIKDRTKGAMQAKIARGEQVTRPDQTKYGYALVDGRVLIDDREQRIILEICTLRRQGMSAAKIKESLVLDGFDPRGKQWNESTIRNIYNREMGV